MENMNYIVEANIQRVSLNLGFSKQINENAKIILIEHTITVESNKPSEKDSV